MDSGTPLASIARDGGRVVLWDSAFIESSPLFWPLAGAASELAAAMACRDAGGIAGEPEPAAFPQPELIDAALGGRAGVRFERQRPVSRRRRRGPRDPELMYDARIAREGCVPTRPGSWHDLMNALVWATFPTAKRALHARQHGLVVPAAPGESARRPRELDALALLDEGGMIVMMPSGEHSAPHQEEDDPDEEAIARAVARGEAVALVFGHAIYEGLVLGREMPLASVVCVDAPAVRAGRVSAQTGPARAALIAHADQALAAVVADRTRLADPKAMLRLRAGP